MKKNIGRKILVYAISILLVAAVVGIIFFMKNSGADATEDVLYEPAKPVMTQEEMEALYDQHKTDVASEMVEETVSENALEEVADGTGYECPVDFEGLWKTNKDVYAWITIPGTEIDYPILQHETDNTYYLNYNIDGSYGYPGCIYTENMNSKDFTDNNTVIYGHNMKNGTMFAGLHKYEDKTFFEENQKILIYTPEEELNYTIFAAYIYDDRHLLYSFDFAQEDVYASYLEEIKNMRSMNALIREDVEVTSQDKIITLVTCIGNQPEKRLLVQAVLEKAGTSFRGLAAGEVARRLARFRRDTDFMADYLSRDRGKLRCPVSVVINRKDLFTEHFETAEACWSVYAEDVREVCLIDAASHYFQAEQAAETLRLICRLAGV